MSSPVRRIQKKLYGIRGVGYSIECLVGLATFPRKLRAQEDRFGRIEQELAARGTPEQAALGGHLPAILNYITSFSHTARELMRRYGELQGALDEAKASHQALKSTTQARLDALEEKLQSAKQLEDRVNQTARENASLASRLGEMWQRIEFIRSETLFEVMHGARGTPSPARAALEPKVMNPEKLSSMGDSLRLNVGAGHLPDPAYLNVDRRELPGVDVVADATHLPFSAASVTELFSSHLLEHFPQEELRRAVLPYWYQLLKPGGVFRAVLPDWDGMIQRYAKGEFPFENLREVTFGSQDYDGDFHYNMFSRESLGQLLKEAGFRDPSFPVVGRANGKCLEMEVRAVK